VWTPALTERWQTEGWRPAVGVWTAGQTAQFLRQVRGRRLYALFHLVALRGLRRGEAAGLRWGDLDLDAGTLTVAGQLQQQAGRAAAGPRWAGTGYVFPTRAGKPVGPDRVTRLFRRLVAASGLPPVTLHGLRHGAATLALAAGTDLKIVQDQLGHSSITLTADTYTSVLPGTVRTAADNTAALLFPASARRAGPVRQQARGRGKKPLPAWARHRHGPHGGGRAA
jgi:integrase